MYVCTCALLMILRSPLSYRSPLPVFPRHFELGGEDKKLILSKSTLPPTLPINHYISSLCVSLFIIHVHVTVSVVLYVVVCSFTPPIGCWG